MGRKRTPRGITTGCSILLADGEGFEPPDELPRQRFSRPSHSTALPTILNFLLCRRSLKPAVLFAVRTCRCCSPLVRARLADSYARPSHSTALPTILNFLLCRRSFKPAVLFAVRTCRCCSPLVRARLRCARLADSYARPSHSTALPTIRTWASRPILQHFFQKRKYLNYLFENS